MYENHCRACFEELKGSKRSVFSRINGVGIDEMLEFTTGIKITRRDNFSTMICRKCCDDTAVAYALKVRCLSTDKRMKDKSEFEQLVMDGLLVVVELDDPPELEPVIIKTEIEPIDIKTEIDPVIIKTEPTYDSFSIYNEPTEPMLRDPIAVKEESVETEVVFITTTTPADFDKMGRKVSRISKMLPIRKCENCDYKATSASDLAQHMKYDRCDQKARPNGSEKLKAGTEENYHEVFVEELGSNTVSRRTPVARQKKSKKNEFAITFRIVDSDSTPLLLEVTDSTKPKPRKENVSNKRGQGSVKDQMKTLKFECDLCGLKYRSRSGIERHIATHISFECEFCYEKFQRKRILSRHKRLNHPAAFPEPYPCRLCNLSFRRRYLLLAHTASKHRPDKEQEMADDPAECAHENCNCSAENPFRLKVIKRNRVASIKCDDCSEAFTTQLRLTNHRKFKHPNQFLDDREEILESGKVSCGECGIVLKQSSLKGHIRSVHERILRFECDACGLKCDSRSSLETHIITHIPIEYRELRFECELCFEKFQTQRNLTRHTKLSHPAAYREPHPCRLCNRTFKRKYLLLAHLRSMHRSDKKPEVAEGPFDCTHGNCNYSTNNRFRLKYHERNHVASFKCDDCSEVFKRKFWLSHHRQSKHPDKLTFHDHLMIANFARSHSYRNNDLRTCEICGVTLKAYSMFTHKTRVHQTKQKDCECDVCGGKFYKSDLAAHLKTHIPRAFVVRPFECDECKLSFVSIQSLRSHKKNQHSPSEPAQCECGKVFANVYKLKAHRAVYHKQRSKKHQNCHLCGEELKRSTNLREHIRIFHTRDGQYNYSCEICGRRFHRATDLSHHRSSRHR